MVPVQPVNEPDSAFLFVIWEFGKRRSAEESLVRKFVIRRGWAYHLMKLLKLYPNTYADISAYDFTDDKEHLGNMPETRMETASTKSM